MTEEMVFSIIAHTISLLILIAVKIMPVT